jgi:hypothetical protein
MNVQTLLANKHTTGAAIAYLAANALEHLGPVWFPSHAQQCRFTGQWVWKMAAAYGLFMAGDAGAPLPPSVREKQQVEEAKQRDESPPVKPPP